MSYTRIYRCGANLSVEHCPSNSTYYTVAVASGATPAYTYYDSLNRALRTDVASFDGTDRIFKDTTYNALGFPERSYRPYFASAANSAIYDWVEYDVLGMPYRTHHRDVGGVDAVTETDYNGLTTTTISPAIKGVTQQASKTMRRDGKLASVTDNLGQTIHYQYDAMGNSIEVDLPDNTKVATQYDLLGRKKTQTSPDTGTWTYSYDALGEVISQTDAKQQTVTMNYDLLGRITQRSEFDMVSTWIYDKCNMGVGKVCSENGGTNSFSRRYVYDNFGRPKTTITHIDRDYTVTTEYDAASRPIAIDYPNGVRLHHVFNAQGYQASLWNNGEMLWQANKVDAEGRTYNSQYGNGVILQTSYDPDSDRLSTVMAGLNSGNEVTNQTYSYDLLGRLGSKTDAYSGVGANAGLPLLYSYDALNRLTGAVQGTYSQTQTYDGTGNVLCKSDVQGSACTGSASYQYSSPTQPHAVQSVTGSINGVTNPSFQYDQNGNMLAGAGRSYTWYSFNLPSTVTSNGHTVKFLYDTGHQRVKETDNGVVTVTLNARLDLGHSYQVVTANGVTTDKVYVSVGGKVIALIQNTDGQSFHTTEWFHHDALGSLVAATNSSGKVTVRYVYDAWGQRTMTLGARGERRGYTGHEELDSIGLINMNARLYDPELARVVSADTLIQNPGDFQTYNRYSYVDNQPLILTDPSGESAWRDLTDPKTFFEVNFPVEWHGMGKLPYGVNQAAITIFSSYCGSMYAACVAAGTYINDRTHGVDGNDAINDAAVAFAFAEANNAIGESTMGVNGGAPQFGETAYFQNVALHAYFGGMQSEFMGGSFREGFVSGGLSSAAAPDISKIHAGQHDFESVGLRVTAAAILGGTVSEIGGGKFANGAIVAAFERAFNAE